MIYIYNKKCKTRYRDLVYLDDLSWIVFNPFFNMNEPSDSISFMYDYSGTQMKLTSLRPGRADPEPCDGPCESRSSSRRRSVCGGNDTAVTLSSLPNRPSPWKRPEGPYSDTSAGYTGPSGRPQTHERKLCEHIMRSSKWIQ